MERSRWRHLDNTALALIRPLTDFSVSKQNRLVARVEGQSTIYSDDSNIVTLATPL